MFIWTKFMTPYQNFVLPLSLLNDFVNLPVMDALKFYINHVIPTIIHAQSRKNLSKNNVIFEKRKYRV